MEIGILSSATSDKLEIQQNQAVLFKETVGCPFGETSWV